MKIKLTKGFWKIGSRETWIFGKHHFFVSFPEYVWGWIKKYFNSFLQHMGFYATTCACWKKGEPEKLIKFHLFMCKDCYHQEIKAAKNESVKR